MSQPDYPETVRCPECTHPYNPDSLTAQQREQTNICPWCNPVEKEEMDEMRSELLVLLDRIDIETTEQNIQDIAHQRFEGESVSGETH